MPGKINRWPEGLLSLLNTKQGQTPKEWDSNLQLSVDMLQFYGAPTRTGARGQSSVAMAVGNEVALQVPQGEFWMAWAVSGRFVNSDATRIGARLEVRVPTDSAAGARATGIGGRTISGMTAGDLFYIVADACTFPLLLRAGDELRFGLTQWDGTVGAVTMTVSALVDRLGPKAQPQP